MKYFTKAFAWTVAVGFALLGIYAGLLAFRIGVEIAGFLLGSTLGTFILLWIMYRLYEKYKDKLFD